MTLEFTVEHDHTVIGDEGEEQLIGNVHFTVQTRPGDFQVRDTGAPTPRTISLPRRTAYLGIDGHLYKDETSGEPFRLVANDPAYNLDHITYRADFELTTLIGESIPVRSCYFPAPSTDTTIYLTKVIIDPDQIVMAVRAQSYVEDILDAGTIGETIVKSNTAAEVRTAIGLDLVDLDEWEWYTNFASFPVSGITTVVYGDMATGALWRWNGSIYTPATQDVAQRIHLASAKTTLANADEFAVVDSAASSVLKKVTVADMAALFATARPITAYGVSIGTSSSQTVAIKAALDANPGKAFYFPPGDYRLNTQLDIANNNSLLLAPGARIYAGAAMTTLINYDNGQTATDSLAADKGICGYGTLDGNLLADKVLRVASVLRFSLEGLTFLDGIHRGLVVDTYAAEVSGHNLRFANTGTTNVSDNVAIEAVGNDCRFSQIGMRDWTIGVWDKGANVWVDVHPWIGTTAQLTARYQNSVAFKIAGDSLFIAPYADTYRYSFQSAQTSPAYAVARIIAPKVFCASGNLTNTLAASYPGVVFYFTDAGGAFIVTQGKFAGHPVTNHAWTSGPATRLFVRDSLPASYITGYSGYDYLPAATWTAANLILGQGERGTESDTGRFKIGNGTTAWNLLPYAADTGATYATMTALKAAGVTSSPARVLGYYTAGDGGGGVFRWDSTDTSSTDNGGTIITPTSALSSAGRWKRVYEGEVNARWFGMHPDLTDNTAFLQKAVDWVSLAYPTIGGTVFIPMGWYSFKFDAGTSGLSTITVAADNVLIRGEGKGSRLQVTNHARPSQLAYFFTFSSGGARHQGGGVKDLNFYGNSMLKWCIYLDTWRDAQFLNISAFDVHSGILDAESTSTTLYGESILVQHLDIAASVGACYTQYGVRFRGGTTASAKTWSDCWIQNLDIIACWDSGVVLDGVDRFSVDNVVAANNDAGVTNTIDGSAKSGCLCGVKITNTYDNSARAVTGHHIVNGVYLESLSGAETRSGNVGVLIEQLNINPQIKWNRISNVVSNGNVGLLKLTDASGFGRLNNTTFIGNRNPASATLVTVGAGVEDTFLYLTPVSGTPWSTAVTDAGTRTVINNESMTETYSNKRITRRVVTVTQAATPTINTDNTDVASITGLAQAITSMTTNLTGTPVAGDQLVVEITDNGTARAITWGAKFEAGSIPLPTTTAISTKLTVVFTWNTVTSAWRVLTTSNYNTLAVTETNKTLTLPQIDRLVSTSGSWLLSLTHGGSQNLFNITNAATGVAPSFGVDSISGDANVDLNLVTKNGKVTVDGTSKIVGVKVAVPASASATGVPGQWAADASWHYVCTATNTWVRSAAATW